MQSASNLCQIIKTDGPSILIKLKADGSLLWVQGHELIRHSSSFYNFIAS